MAYTASIREYHCETTAWIRSESGHLIFTAHVETEARYIKDPYICGEAWQDVATFTGDNGTAYTLQETPSARFRRAIPV